MRTTRPSKPSARRVSAALAPARLAPTITKVFSAVMACPCCRGEELPAGPGVISALAAHAREFIPTTAHLSCREASASAPSLRNAVRAPWRLVAAAASVMRHACHPDAEAARVGQLARAGLPTGERMSRVALAGTRTADASARDGHVSLGSRP